MKNSNITSASSITRRTFVKRSVGTLLIFGAGVHMAYAADPTCSGCSAMVAGSRNPSGTCANRDYWLPTPEANGFIVDIGTCAAALGTQLEKCGTAGSQFNPVHYCRK